MTAAIITITTEERLAYLRAWQATMQSADQRLSDALDRLKVAPESPLWAVPRELQNAYMMAVAKLVGDTENCLDWHAYENDFGKKAGKAGLRGHEHTIRTVDDLLWLIDLQAKP